MRTKYFFIVGAQRSGTSYLYTLLAEHPEIEMAKPLRPEPKFFLRDSLFCRGLDHYENYFSEGKARAWLRGEKSVSYMESEKAARRLAAHFPKAKLLFLLRDPIERAISNYWFSVSHGWETVSMAEAFFHEERRRLDYDPQRVSVSPYAYLSRGRYIDYISMYERYFPIKNMRIVLYEQLVKSVEVIRDIYAFLGANCEFVPSTHHGVVNQGKKPDISLDADLQRYLSDSFAESNLRLAERFGLDLREWGSYEPATNTLQSSLF